MRATRAVPSGPRTDCGVSTWIFEAEGARGQAERILETGAGADHRLDLGDAGDLREGDGDALERAAGGVEAMDEAGQGAHAPGAGGAFEGLEADAGEGWRGAVALAVGEGGRGSVDVGVLLVVGASPVAVLQVDPQVLDRFAVELGGDEAEDVGGSGIAILAVGRGRERLRRVLRQELLEEGRVGGKGLARLPAPALDEGSLPRRAEVGVRRDVDRVHRLPCCAVAREARGQGGVVVAEHPVELCGEVGGEVGCGHAPQRGTRAARLSEVAPERVLHMVSILGIFVHIIGVAGCVVGRGC